MITEKDMTEVMQGAASRFANYVVKNRQIADIRDGLLPVQRFVLLATHDNTKNHKFVKSARIAADTIGKYHPHNPDAAYGALTKMTANHAPCPLILGQGAFGSLIDNPSDMRYTEAGLSPYGKSFLDPDYMDCVPYVSNYDGRDRVPVFLPAKLPNILLNGTFGIAYGYAARLPAFSVASVAKIIRRAMRQEGKITDKDCDALQPVFVDRATWVRTNEYEEFLRTGIGAIKIEPVLEIRGRDIHIVGLYEINLNTFSDRMRKIPEVRHVADNSAENCEIVVYCTKADAAPAVAEIIRKDLTTTKSLQGNLLINDIGPDYVDDNETLPSILSTYSIPRLIQTWCDYRVEIEKQVLSKRIAQNNQIIDRNDTLCAASDNIGAIAKLLGGSLSPDDLEKRLMTILNISLAGAKLVLDTPLRRLTNLNANALDADSDRRLVDNNALSLKIQNIYESTATTVERSFDELRSATKA